MAVSGIKPERLRNLAAQAGGRVLIMVQVQLHFSQPGTRQIRQPLEIGGGILFGGEEERVLGMAAVGVAKPAREPGITFVPAPDSGLGHHRPRAAPQRLEVITKGEQQVPVASIARGRSSRDELAQVSGQPCLQVLHHRSCPYSPSTMPARFAGETCSIARRRVRPPVLPARATRTSTSTASSMSVMSGPASTGGPSTMM